MWCWPNDTPGDGLSYEVLTDDGEWRSLPEGRLDASFNWGISSHDPWYAPSICIHSSRSTVTAELADSIPPPMCFL